MLRLIFNQSNPILIYQVFVFFVCKNSEIFFRSRSKRGRIQQNLIGIQESFFFFFSFVRSVFGFEFTVSDLGFDEK